MRWQVNSVRCNTLRYYALRALRNRHYHLRGKSDRRDHPQSRDGNQYMNHFLSWDIIKSPDLKLLNGKLPVLDGPGLGFELDWDNVKQAAELFEKGKQA